MDELYIVEPERKVTSASLLAEPKETRSIETPECEHWHFARALAQQFPFAAATQQFPHATALKKCNEETT